MRRGRPPDQMDAQGRLLRRYVSTDAPALHAAIEASREHLRPFLPFASRDPDDVEFRMRWIERVDASFEDGRSFNYGIFDGAELVGGCSIDPKSGAAASIGYWVHVAQTRRGHATAAARALTGAAVDAGYDPVLLRHDAANHASAAIAHKLGFERVRTEPHSIDAPGQTGTSVVWALPAHPDVARPLR